MRAFLLVFVALVVVPTSRAADNKAKPPKGWIEYRPRFGSFSVWLPDKGGRRSERDRPLRVARSLVRASLVHLRLNDGAVYSAGVVTLPLRLFRQIPRQQRREVMRDAFVEYYKGKIEKEADVKQGPIPAKEYTISTGRGLVRLRLFMVGSRLYQALVEGSKEQVQSKDATTFLNSFGLPSRPTGTSPGTGTTPTPTAKDKLAGKAATVIPGEKFGFLQAAVKDKRLADTEIKGFTLTNKVYRDACEEGGILIGFQVGLQKFFNKDIIESLRPIYLTKTGEKMGDRIGPKPAKPVIVKAKPGYVVGGLTIRTGLGIDGFSLRFVKLAKGRVQLKDSYQSDWIGNDVPGGQRSAVPGQGYFFVGVCGHLNRENTPCSLGLIAVLRPKN